MFIIIEMKNEERKTDGMAKATESQRRKKCHFKHAKEEQNWWNELKRVGRPYRSHGSQKVCLYACMCELVLLTEQKRISISPKNVNKMFGFKRPNGIIITAVKCIVYNSYKAMTSTTVHTRIHRILIGNAKRLSQSHLYICTNTYVVHRVTEYSLNVAKTMLWYACVCEKIVSRAVL